jgi:hypothetical protein
MMASTLSAPRLMRLIEDKGPRSANLTVGACTKMSETGPCWPCGAVALHSHCNRRDASRQKACVGCHTGRRKPLKWPSVSWIQNMTKTAASLSNEAFVVPAGCKPSVRKLNSGNAALRVLRIADMNRPRRSIGLRTDGTNVSSQINEPVCGPSLLTHGGDAIRGRDVSARDCSA